MTAASGLATERAPAGVAPVRIAVAGAGAIGRTHLGLVRRSAECALAAVIDPASAAKDLAADAGVPWFATLGEALRAGRGSGGIDGVIIATPNPLHVEQALACIDAGVAALVEKPVAHTVAEGERLCRVVEERGARVLVGHHRAHSPLLAKAREIVRGGGIGDVVAVTGAALFYKPDGYFDEAPWRRRAGGGPILINLIHEIGNLRSLCGEIVAVQAFASSATRGFEVEDTAAILLRFASGALGAFVLSDTAATGRSWEQTTRENKAYATYPDEDCYFLAGTRGSLAFPTMRLKRFARDEDRSWFNSLACSVVDVERADPLVRQLHHFCAVARGETLPLVSVRDGLMNLRVVEAIGEAARTGGVVRVGEAAQAGIAVAAA